MFLSKRSNGIYYIFYEQANGKRTSKSTGTKYKSEALKYLTNFKSTLMEHDNPIMPITLERFRFKFLLYSESIHSDNHTKSLRTSLNALLSYFGNVQLCDLTQVKLQEFVEYRLRNVSAYTVKRDIADFSSAFKWGLSKRYLKMNPVKGIKKPKIPQKMPLFFSEDEFATFLCKVKDPDLHNLFEFASLTGLRQSDLINLEWAQINFINRSIILDNRSTLTKSRKVHTLPLNTRAINILEHRKKDKDNSIIVFTFQGKKIKQSLFSRKFKKLVKAAKLNPDLTFHSIRHSFASWLVQKGVSIYHVSKLLTHSDLRVTQIYAHVRTDDLRESIRVLDSQNVYSK